MDEAYYTVQRYGLQELYQYLMSDFSKLISEGQNEMEYLKGLIIERMKEKDSEDVYNVSLYTEIRFLVCTLCMYMYMLMYMYLICA